MNPWMVEIEAEEFDLRRLLNLNYLPNISIRTEGDRHYLRSDEFDGCTEAAEVVYKGANILNVINGIAQLEVQDWCYVKFRGVARDEPDGSRTQFLFAKSVGESRMSADAVVIKADGTIDTSREPSFLEKAFAVAGRDARVEKAMRIYGTREHNWVNLYIIYEIIESDVGGRQTLVNSGWSSDARIRNFKHTANSVGAVGDEARHGKELNTPPAKPMSLSEAKEFIATLLKEWVNSK